MQISEEKLIEIYRNNALVMTEINLAAGEYRKQYYHDAGLRVLKIINELKTIVELPLDIDLSGVAQNLSGIIDAFQSYDYVLCADLLSAMLQDTMIPLQNYLRELLSDYHNRISDDIYQKSEGKFEIEDTLYGYPTILSHTSRDNVYLCSNEDPMNEGFILANEAFEPKASKYIIWGLGLGYHVYALNELLNDSAAIYIYDNDKFLIDLTNDMYFGVWQEVFNKSNIKLMYDPDMTQFMNAILSKDTKTFIHMPSVFKLPDSSEVLRHRKTVLKKLRIQLDSYDQIKNTLMVNFYRNIRNTDKYAEELFPVFDDKNVVVVGAGPSLDANLDKLKEVIENGGSFLVIAVGTVYNKLMNNGIKPDVVCFMDAQPRTFKQLENLQEEKIPIIVDTTAFYRFTSDYAGDKYLACQEGFEPAEKLGHVIFESGGSVTTLAIDFAIKAHARTVTLMGCDLAFTGGASHAKGTMDLRDAEDEVALHVKSFDGNTVGTSILFTIYREWIENRITKDDASDISFYNVSEGGAFIKGMKHVKFELLLSEIK